MRSISFIILAFIFSFFCVAGVSCNRTPYKSLERVLQESAINTNIGYFYPEDDFIFFGEIVMDTGDKIFVAQNCHVWGEALRMTGRILVFNSLYELAGMYVSITDKPILDGNKLIFPFPEETGNIIDFKHGIPSKVWLDGHIFEYESVSSIK
ncbi:MAG: hypothetical protein LBI06_04700 [Treponema sp.]|jgi:hypothetical protein|nr:hypothetical protein [Treponema sp.]